MGIYSQPFDPRRDFVVQAAFLCNGKMLHPGTMLDKDSVDIRTLRLLYENRKVFYLEHPRSQRLLGRAGGLGKAAPAQRKPRITPSPVVTELSPDELIVRLMARYSKTDLLAQAAALPDVKRTMTKGEIAAALVRAGHGVS